MRKKALPPPTRENVLPPILNRNYFEDGKRHPFRPRAHAFELVNAWWLAEAALLAYADQAFAKPQYAAAGLLEVEFLSSSSGSQCYVASNDDVVIVAFRGTQVPKPGTDPDRVLLLREVVKDFGADVDFCLVESGQGGCVHSGFKSALDRIWPELRQQLSVHLEAGRPIWMTGHSLGAALATLAADRFGTVQGLCTFGSPCVGDRAFADGFHVNAYRFVHNRDVVTRVPPFGMYKPSRGGKGQYVHVGALKFIDADGRLFDDDKRSASLIGLLGGTLADLLDESARFRLGRLLQLQQGLFDDHAPLYYALRAWNAYVESRS